MYLVLPVCIVTSDVIGVPLESTRSHSTSCECWLVAPETFKKASLELLVAEEAGEGWRPEEQTNPLPGQLLLEIPNNRWLEARAWGGRVWG